MNASSSSYAWMLLLLHLFCTLHQSSAAPTAPTTGTCLRAKKDLFINVTKLKSNIEHCDKNCNSSVASNTECQCLHLTVQSQKMLPFPDYFIAGLQSLRSASSDYFQEDTHIQLIISILNEVCKCAEVRENFCSRKRENQSIHVDYSPIVSPEEFFETLINLIQSINTN